VFVWQHYDLVEYFLDEVGMDVNVRNSSGMPACWFAAIFLNKFDGTRTATATAVPCPNKTLIII
jgi:Ankyrin repeats (many copies)